MNPILDPQRQKHDKVFAMHTSPSSVGRSLARSLAFGSVVLVRFPCLGRNMGYKSNYVNDLFTNTLARPFFALPCRSLTHKHTCSQIQKINCRSNLCLFLFAGVAFVFYRFVSFGLCVKKCACHFNCCAHSFWHTIISR